MKALYITFIVDVSGSIFVDGHRNKISHTLRTLVQELSSFSRQNPDYPKVFSRLLNYSSEVRWLDGFKKYCSISELNPTFPLKSYLSNFGLALNEYRSAKPLIKPQGENVLIWVSDGFVTDDWDSAFRELSNIPVFQNVKRVSIYPEGHIKYSSLIKFCGEVNNVFSSRDIGLQFCRQLVEQVC